MSWNFLEPERLCFPDRYRVHVDALVRRVGDFSDHGDFARLEIANLQLRDAPHIL